MSKFAQDVFERALKTFAQSLLSVFVAGQTVLTINWAQALAVAGTAALVSVLTSLGSATFTATGSPSLVKDPFPSRHFAEDKSAS